jgi:hypothetical protein
VLVFAVDPATLDTVISSLDLDTQILVLCCGVVCGLLVAIIIALGVKK